MKKALCCTLVAAMLLCANGCSGGGTANNDLSSNETSAKVDLEKADEIESNIIENAPEAFDRMYWSEGLLEDNIQVFVQEGKASIIFRLNADWYIPYFADGISETVRQATETAGVESVEINVRFYLGGNNEPIDGTMANWRTTDYCTGTFVNDADGTLKPAVSIEAVYEYYIDYQPLVYSAMREAGYTGSIWGETTDLQFTVEQLLASLKEQTERNYSLTEEDGGYGLPTVVIAESFGHCQIACLVEENGYVSAVIIRSKEQNGTVKATYKEACKIAREISPEAAFAGYYIIDEYKVFVINANTVNIEELSPEMEASHE